MNFATTPQGQRKNLTGITVVALLHVMLLGLALSGSKLTVFKQTTVAVDLEPTPEATPPRVEPEPIPLAQPAQPTIFTPPIETAVVPSNPPPLSHVTTEPPPATPPHAGAADGSARTPAVKAAPLLVAAVIDASACAKPDYPKNALRNGDTGTVTLALLVGVDGKVVESKVDKSSGFRELDRAAQVGLGLCKFKPGSVDGVPQQLWTRMQYVWSLND